MKKLLFPLSLFCIVLLLFLFYKKESIFPRLTGSSPTQSKIVKNRFTKKQFNQIKKGMTRKQVEKLLGAPGVKISISPYVPQSSNKPLWEPPDLSSTVVYRWQNNRQSFLYVQFTNDKVDSAVDYNL